MSEQKEKTEEAKKAEEAKETEKAKEKLKECEKLRDEYLAGWQRAKADFLNYKKEELEKIKVWQELIEADCFLSFLEIYENLEKAGENPDKEGINQIVSQFRKILDEYEIKEIAVAGGDFDPCLHEAVETIDDSGQSGKIIAVLQKGYLIKGRLLKPAKVKVAK